MTRTRHLVVVLAVSALASTACGLKPSATQAFKAGGGQMDPGTGPLTSPAEGDPRSAAGDAGGTTRRGTGGGRASGGVTGGGPSMSPVDEGSTVGIRDNTIHIAFHAPISDTRPIATDSFREGLALFWKDKTVRGMKVEVTVHDDRSTPSGARPVCERLGETNFAVVAAAMGPGGIDQVKACATSPLMAARRVPYLSAGTVTVTGPTYQPLSLTYEQQGELVARNAQQNFPRGRWSLVVASHPDFDDALRGIKAALDRRGIGYDVIRTDVGGNVDANALQTGRQLAQLNNPVVYFLTAPTYFIATTKAASGQLYDPWYTGVGVSMGLNQIASQVCNGNRDFTGNFLSPFPGLDRAPAGFDDAVREQGADGDDTQLSLYGLSERVYQALTSVHGPLTRESFATTLERVLRNMDVSFGGRAAWSLRADCTARARGEDSDGMWVTVGDAPLAL